MFRELIGTTFFRHASILQAGSIVQFGISFVGSVLIARLLGPDAYGVWALAVALAGVIALLLEWGQGYGSTILFSKSYATGDMEEMRRVGAFYIKTTVLLYFFIGVPAFLLAEMLGVAFYNHANLGNYVRLLLLSGLLAAGTGLVAFILQVVRKVWFLALTDNISQFLKTSAMLGGLFLGLGVLGVAGGQMVGTALSFLITVYLYRRYVQPTGVVPHIRSMLRRVRNLSVRTYLSYSFPIAIDRNISELYNVGMLLLLGRLAPPAEVGFFRIALSYTSLSIFMLGSVSRLLQDQFPKDYVRDPKILRSHFIKVSALSGLLVMGGGTVLVLLGPLLVRLVYGDAYADVVPFIQAFWWYTAVMGFGIGLASLFRTLDRVMFAVKLHAVILSLGFPISYYLTRELGAIGAVYGITAMKGLATLIGLWWGLTLLSRNPEARQAPPS